MSTNTTDEKIIQEHSSLIHRVVMHCNNPGSVPDLEMVLQQAEANDWKQLVIVIRELMIGNDDIDQSNLDQEDSVIINSILRGLKDLTTLPVMGVDLSSRLTATGIAGLIHAATHDNTQAEQLVESITTQLNQSGGDMTILASRIPSILDGMRNQSELSEEMTSAGQQMVTELIEELTKLEDSH